MPKKKETALAKTASEDQLLTLQQEFPTEPTFNRILLPRLGLVTQDITEGKGKSKKVVTEAGTFFIERQTEEIDEETGKKKWEREEIGDTIEGIILFQRRQLRMYDEAKEEYTSSPIYDADTEEVPLFCNKTEVNRGTPKELKEEYKYTDKKGKTKSALEDNRILYVLYDGEMYQMNLRGSSMYAFMSYARSIAPNTVITEFSSEYMEKGDIEWNKMTFNSLRTLNGEEAEDVIARTKDIKEGIVAEKQFFAAQNGTGKRDDESDEEYEERREREKDF